MTFETAAPCESDRGLPRAPSPRIVAAESGPFAPLGQPVPFSNPLWAFGLPPDRVAAMSLAVAVLWATSVALFGRREATWSRLSGLISKHHRVLLGLLAGAALLLSAGYIAYYLRGGPRIIDASAYFLEARALAEGKLAFEVPSPSASFRGRFLTHAPFDPSQGGELSLGVLFPPGYPAALAVGFWLSHPLWLGPILGALLVLVTFALARRLTKSDASALLAAGLSVVSAALRYHTADTMSHGFAALLFSGALLAALPPDAPNDSRRANALRALVCGLCLGWLFATRPVTAVVCALSCGVLLGARAPKSALPLLIGALPGVVLFLAHQRAVTGSLWTSAQMHYYALADGPPGCFGLGFGAGKGCEHEHGDVVARFGAAGYSLRWVVLHTLHRLHGHTLDLANFEPLWLVVPLTLLRHRKERVAQAFAVALAGTVVLYSAFYFNGSYPGGGARFFAELLPLEHAIFAWGVGALFQRRYVLPLSLAGFALHASFSHRALSERDGGKPLFEASVLETHGATEAGALVLVDSDHGHNLGFAPNALTSERALLVARHRGDARDRLLWERRGRPLTYIYQFEPWPTPSRLVPLDFAAANPVLRFEAEAEWPPLGATGAWAAPSALSCASAGRVLRLHPTGSAGEVLLELPVRRSGSQQVRLGMAGPVPPSGSLHVRVGPSDVIGRVTRPSVQTSACWMVDLGELMLAEPAASLHITTGSAPLDVDFVETAPPGQAATRSPEPPH